MIVTKPALSQSYRVLVLERGGVPYGNPNLMTQERFLATLTEVDTFDSHAQAEDGVPNARGHILGLLLSSKQTTSLRRLVARYKTKCLKNSLYGKLSMSVRLDFCTEELTANRLTFLLAGIQAFFFNSS